MKKSIIKTLYIFIIFLSVFFSGCDNSFSKPNESAKFVTLSGVLINSGAFPSEIAALINDKKSDQLSRTAFATIPDTTGVDYVVKAVNTAVGSTETYDGEVTGNSYVISIPVTDSGKTYKITASLIQSDKTILYGESEVFTVSESTPLASRNQDVTLEVQQTAGKTGSVYLQIEIEGGNQITKCKTSLNDYETAFSFSSNKTIVNLSGIPSGSNPTVFNFYDNNNKLLYFFRDTVNVFDNLKTDTWFQNGNEPWFETTTDGEGVKTTKCKITNAMLEGFGLTEIYIDENATGLQTGTVYNPVTSMADAIAKCLDENKDYIFYIKGTLHGTQTISNNLSCNADNNPYHARSLTICGASLPVGGVPQCILDGGFSAGNEGTTLVVSSSTGLPVTIKNLKITGGYAASAGGGIFNIGQVILDRGSLVEGNHSKGDGGGVYSNGIFVLNGGMIKNNTADGKGGAVYNSNLFRIKGASYIPAGSNGKHDVYCTVASSNGYVQLETPLDLPAAANGIAAKLTPATYARGKFILGVISGGTTTVAVEKEKFAITPEPGVSPDPGWAISNSGYIATLGEVDATFVLPLEDIFTITGKGTVVCGKVESGSLYAGLGVSVDLVGNDQILHATANGIEMFNREIIEAATGDNIGVLLSGVSKNDLTRGMIMCKPGQFTNHKKFRATIYLRTAVEGGRTSDVPSNYRPQFYLRTTDITGGITFADSDLYTDGDTQKVRLGSTYNVTVDLVKGFPLSENQEFSIRESGKTVGTGTITALLD